MDDTQNSKTKIDMTEVRLRSRSDQSRRGDWSGVSHNTKLQGLHHTNLNHHHHHHLLVPGGGPPVGSVR